MNPDTLPQLRSDLTQVLNSLIQKGKVENVGDSYIIIDKQKLLGCYELAGGDINDLDLGGNNDNNFGKIRKRRHVKSVRRRRRKIKPVKSVRPKRN